MGWNCWEHSRLPGYFHVHHVPGGCSSPHKDHREANTLHILHLCRPVPHSMALGPWDRTKEMWAGGRLSSEGPWRVGMPFPRTELMASSTLTSALLRDIRDFRHCEISPCPEDMSVQICLRSTPEAMPLHHYKFFWNEKGKMSNLHEWHYLLNDLHFVHVLKFSAIESLMDNIFSGIEWSSDTNPIHQNWALVQIGQALICRWLIIISSNNERGLKTSYRPQLL